ncbi:hypothetical protein [Seonamhaeicola sp.]|uniref:hypothetical protein n=1 Tax=Seonamhaeicola sp. TaxID=1912245 RepID=UPI00260D162B|nr:hypothetical protein [Seonamhaeicola sp.]
MATIYSLFIEEDQTTLFENFLNENKTKYFKEVKDIVTRLKVIGNDTGAREQFFKLNEGNIGDGVCALYDTDKSNLRLYCVRFGMALVVVGGGGFKPKSIRALQDDPKLTYENLFLREFVKELMIKMKDKDIRINYSMDPEEFDGDLEFNINI